MTNFAEKLSVSGTPTIELYSNSGELIHQQTVSNLVTSEGKNFLTNKIVGLTETISFISIGTGTTAATLNDSQMESEVAKEDVRFQSTENNIASFIATFAEDVPSNNETITEVGLVSDNDLLICRAALDTSFVKNTTDYLVINWKIQIG